MTLAPFTSAITPSAEIYGYTTCTNRLAALTDGNGTRAIAYDNRGNTLTETRSGNVTVALSSEALS